MIIDLTELITSNLEELSVDVLVLDEKKRYQTTTIKGIKNTHFLGSILKLYDNNTYKLSGLLEGVMILPDDITQEDVEYPFSVNIDENFNGFSNNDLNNLRIIQNRLDISDFLWQNILVEIPLKVKLPKNENLTLKGNGWRLVTEEELKSNNNSPLSELSKILDSRKE